MISWSVDRNIMSPDHKNPFYLNIDGCSYRMKFVLDEDYVNFFNEIVDDFEDCIMKYGIVDIVLSDFEEYWQFNRFNSLLLQDMDLRVAGYKETRLLVVNDGRVYANSNGIEMCVTDMLNCRDMLKNEYPDYW